MTEPSPYREIGLSGHYLTKGPKRKKVRICIDKTKVVKYGHRFFNPNNGLSPFEAHVTGLEICHLCGKPRFLVQEKECRGKR